MRIVTLLTRMEHAREVIRLTARKAAALDAGVTLLYVREERLFELPIFGEEEPSLDAAREYLLSEVREAGGEKWAVLAYDDDPVDHLLLEAERERAELLIAEMEEEREKLIARTRVPVLFPKTGTTHRCAKGLIVLDAAYSEGGCLPFVRRVLEATEWSAYMDFQILPTMGTDLSLDPVVDTLATGLEVEQELKEIREKAFRELCEAEGMEGYFEIGEQGIAQDILSRAAVVEAECLAVIAEDHDTLLAEALGELAAEAKRDLLICFQH
jgi:hypothetical protein